MCAALCFSAYLVVAAAVVVSSLLFRIQEKPALARESIYYAFVFYSVVVVVVCESNAWMCVANLDLMFSNLMLSLS